MLRQKKRLLLGVLLSIITGNTLLMLFIVALVDKQASDQLRLLRIDKEDAIIKELKGRVESAHSIMRHFSETHENQRIAQKKSMEAIESIRFGLDNYIWIHQYNPHLLESAHMLVHPAKNLVGRELTNLIDLDIISDLYHQGKIYKKNDPEISHIRPTNLFLEFNRTCLQKGKGTVAYFWPKIVGSETSTTGYLKLSYVQCFPKWNWVVGAGGYADHIDQMVESETRRIQHYKQSILQQAILIITSVSFLILLFVFFQIKSSITTQHHAEKILLEAKQAAEKANSAKSEFLANISHEIRTPMNSIMGMTNLLLKRPVNKGQRTHLEMIKSSTERLLQVINDILDFSMIEKGKLTLINTPFDLNKLLGELVTTMRLTAENKGITLQLSLAKEVPHRLVGDANRLQQVLINILGNGIKFTDKGGVIISVSELSASHAGHHTLLFQIEDTGIGIPENMHETIFQSFSQVDTSFSRKHGGTGLGLAVSKTLVDLMGGEIGLKSQLGKGSTFWFTATFERVDNNTGKPSENNEGRSEQKREIEKDFAGKEILVADDELLNRALLRTLLEEKKMRVVEARNGADVLRAVEKKRFDLILMDIQMPELDGLSATVQIRELEKQRSIHTPIIAITAHALETDKEKCLTSGMDDYLSKPLDTETLYETIAKYI